jgi:virulence factor Mce-like protein
MTPISPRVRTNIAWLVIVSFVLSIAGLVRWVGPGVLGNTYQLTVAVPDGGGIQAGHPVTVLGTEVGTVSGVRVTREAVEVVLEVEREHPVPRSAVVQVLRRSPIGEQAVELTPVPPGWRASDRVVPSRLPVDGDWRAADPGSRLDPAAVVVPSSVPALLDRAERLFAAIPGPQLATVVDELATAVDGRVPTLQQLNRDAAELTGTLATAIPDADRLIRASRDVLAALHAQRHDLATAISDTAGVVETLAASRPAVERVLTDASPMFTRLDTLIRDQRPNVVCLGDDLTAVGGVLAQPDNRVHLARILDLNRFFYGGFDAGTQWDPYRPGHLWARVNILIEQEPGGQPKVPLTPTPATRPGAACTSSFGPGVQAVRQTDPPPLPPDPTAPGIDYAPLVAGADAGDHDGVRASGPDAAGPGEVDGRGPARDDLPATGGGAGLVAIGTALSGWLLGRRRGRGGGR